MHLVCTNIEAQLAQEICFKKCLTNALTRTICYAALRKFPVMRGVGRADIGERYGRKEVDRIQARR